MTNRRDEPRRALLNANITKEVAEVIKNLSDKEKDDMIEKYYSKIIIQHKKAKHFNQ